MISKDEWEPAVLFTYLMKGWDDTIKSGQGITVGIIINIYDIKWASQVALVVKNLPANAEDIRDQVQSLGPKIPWRRAWPPTPVIFP